MHDAGGVLLAGGTPPRRQPEAEEVQEGLPGTSTSAVAPGEGSYEHHQPEADSSVIAAARFGSKTLQV